MLTRSLSAARKGPTLATAHSVLSQSFLCSSFRRSPQKGFPACEIAMSHWKPSHAAFVGLRLSRHAALMSFQLYFGAYMGSLQKVGCSNDARSLSLVQAV